MLIWRERPEPAQDYPEWTKPLFAAACATVVGLGGILLAGRRSLFATVPNAWPLLMALTVAAGLGLAIVWAAYRWSATRRLLLRIVAPETVTLALACGAGVLLGSPTILWQPHRVLQSMDAYRRSYVDLERTAWPLWQNITWYVKFYVNQAAPLPILVAFVLAGMVLAVFLRRRDLLSIAAGALLFFFSKPLNLQAPPHHIIMWLPYYAILAALPAAVGWQLVRRKPVYTRVAALALFAGCLAFLWVSLAPGVRAVAANQALNEQRMTAIREATAWIKGNTETDTTVLVAYFCFNEDIVYSLFKAMAVPVPARVWDGRKWIIWWGHARAFRGRSGYALATSSDVRYTKKNLDLHEPGEGTDPYTDTRFQLVRSFGKAPTSVDVFRFHSPADAGTVRGKE
jgi:hypothetical protein